MNGTINTTNDINPWNFSNWGIRPPKTADAPSAGYNYGSPAGNLPYSPDFSAIPANPNTPSGSFFGDGSAQNPGMLIPGLQAFNGLANAFTGYKSLKLAEDQFGLNKDQYNRDLANQTQVFNTQLQELQAQRMRQNGTYNTATPEGAAAFERDLQTYVTNNRVNGSPIG